VAEAAEEEEEGEAGRPLAPREARFVVVVKLMEDL